MRKKSLNTTAICLIALIILSLTSIVFIEFNRDLLYAGNSNVLISLFEEDQIKETTMLKGLLQFVQAFVQTF
ncbi:hypothetical protein [Membranihabitans marinus]|uniref:hypothetical protein n=1 Tax=Membranihabitans marinus TaxID=1227546 RepID=UPI001F2A8AC7|nr:hypothetical protein [Membranihabitans marinus]